MKVLIKIVESANEMQAVHLICKGSHGMCELLKVFRVHQDSTCHLRNSISL